MPASSNRAARAVAAAIALGFWLLTGCASPLPPAEGWWGQTRPERPRQPADSMRTWAAHRPLAHDTLIHEFVRELLAQGRMLPGADAHTTFYLGSTLFEQAPYPYSARCSSCNSPDLSYRLLLQLVKRGTLTPADTLYMQQQLRGAAEHRLVQELLPGSQIVPLDTLFLLARRLGHRQHLQAAEILRERYHTRHLFWLSLPLFSCDRQTVIVDISFSCGGLCGAGTSYVVRRQHNRWHIIRQVENWVS